MHSQTFEPVMAVKGDLYTPFIDKAEETVAELTYKRAFEIYGNPPLILSICELKKN